MGAALPISNGVEKGRVEICGNRSSGWGQGEVERNVELS